MLRFSHALGLSTLVTALTLTGGCTPPPTTSATRVSFENDYFLPARTGLGKSEQAITIGDGPNGEQVLFVNFDGASILLVDNDGSSENSANNSSWIPDTYSIGQSKAFAAFNTSPYSPSYTKASAQAYVISAVQGWYADFNLYVVSTRPTSGRYTELMVGDTTQNFSSSSPQGVVGLATLDCNNSSQVNVGFDFAASIAAIQPPQSASDQTSTLLLVAQTVAHEAGHTFGLEHVNNSQDIMNPSVSDSVVGFIDSANALSQGSASCGSGSTQNSHARLLSNLGPAPSTTGSTLPNVQFLAPKNGDTVPSTFTVAVSASEPVGATATITKVDLYQGSNLLGTFSAPPYQGSIQAPDGSFTLTAVATNSDGKMRSVDSQFTVSSTAPMQVIGCIVSTDCVSPMLCEAGTCVTQTTAGCDPPCASDEVCQSDGTCAQASSSDGGTMTMTDGGTTTGGGIGAACTDSSQCADNGLCAQSGKKQFCTNVCDHAASNACPSGYACTDVGGTDYCTPKSSGGCSFVGWRAAPSSASFLLLGAALLLLISRRKSRPSAT